MAQNGSNEENIKNQLKEYIITLISSEGPENISKRYEYNFYKYM